MRPLVIDECFNHRMATELRRRGRESRSLKELQIGGEDPDMLRALRETMPEAVLVTDDDKMPLVHRDVIAETGTTIAIIPSLEATRKTWITANHGDSPSETHKWEVIHRWAHAMALQDEDTRIRYSLRGKNMWTPRVRPVPMFIQQELKRAM